MSGIYRIGSYTVIAQSGRAGSGPLRVGIGDTLQDAYDSLDATALESHESEYDGIRWAAANAWPDEHSWDIEERDAAELGDEELSELDDECFDWCVEHLDVRRLRKDAATSHQSAKEWYEAYGAGISTENAGEVMVQIVEYDWLDAEDDESVVEHLSKSDLTADDREQVVALARRVREAADEVSALLDDAVEAYQSGDADETIKALRLAKSSETDHGDWPATSALADQLLVRGSSSL